MIRRIIEISGDDIEIVQEAEDGLAAFELWDEHRPDVIVLDGQMPGATGLEVAARILRVEPDQHIIFCTAYLDDETVARAEEIGVRECISKQQLRMLPEVIRKLFPS